ncbi:MAG: class A beta-lactamase-related serine hydrolase [Chloroflexota bacterium]|nr:MAG: class A beta-lactamase-related serine hydrolase [Chloroflexota bacterium]
MISFPAIDQVLERAIASGEVPGVVAIAVTPDGVLYEGAFGSRELGKRSPIALDTVFGIASMTKAITVAALLQLAERGLVALDDPATRFLPELAAIQVLDGFDAAGTPRLRQPRRGVGIRHLLTHTAGFAYPVWNADLHRYSRLPAGGPEVRQPPFVFDPGERWEYGTNIDWIGRIVERVSGQSLERYFREHIFDRLGMTDTGFLLPPERMARIATSHQRQSDGSLRPIDVQRAERPPTFNGGGGLFSTGPDYARFLRMLLRGGELDGAAILRPETVAAMGRNQIGPLNVCPLASFDAGRSNPIEFFPGTIAKWGFGGLINITDTPTGRSAGSWAWAGLANTYFWVDSTRRVAGLLLTQIYPFRDHQVVTLLDEFERAVYASIG